MNFTLTVEHVSQQFGSTTALDDINLTLVSGKIYGLLGRNGSGKSTLLSIIAAFRKPSSGKVLIDGEPVFENAGLMSQICLIRDVVDVEDDVKVSETFDFAAMMRPNWDQAYADDLARRFSLDLKTKAKKLSRGQRSALGIVLGLASRAPLTMFDESYLGMDAPSRYVFYDELLAEYMRTGRTFIISTHLIEEVSSVFEEVVILDRGKVLLQEERDDLLMRGAAITGPITEVDRFTEGLRVINARSLGPTKSAMVFGDIDRRAAALAGLDIGPVELQDLFVHLTGTPEER